MTYEEIRFAWNAQADDEKQWNSLTEAEKIEWAAIIAAVKARGPAPIFHQKAQKNLEHLQRKGFNVVGYALEHCNSWTDNRSCTVDSKGLVRWMVRFPPQAPADNGWYVTSHVPAARICKSCATNWGSASWRRQRAGRFPSRNSTRRPSDARTERHNGAAHLAR